MRLDNFDFEKPNDKDILKALKRTFKDDFFINGYPVRLSNKELISSCYNRSRKTHAGESTAVNYMYWPGDIGHYLNNRLLNVIWISRVISIVDKRSLNNTIRRVFTDVITSLLKTSVSLSKREKILFEDNVDVIGKAYTKITGEKSSTFINSLRSIVSYEKSDIPF